MFIWLIDILWDRPRRNIDLDILWPACKEQAVDIDHARAAFFSHVVNDPAWTRHYNYSTIFAIVDCLK
jgi:hypothetical protein